MRRGSYQLPLSFDVPLLQQDLSQIQESDWVSHFVKIHYEKGWSGVALRSANGESDNLEPGAAYYGTPTLAKCSYFQEVLNSFKTETHRVRLLRLDAGSVIEEHIDPGTGQCQALVRLHIPIVTHDQVEFYCDGKRVVMLPGELWFIDTSYPHAVFNHSSIDRVHLVIDCVVNDWVRSLFPTYFAEPNWQRELSYKIRVVRFMFRDLRRLHFDIHSKEFHRRLNIIINELGLSGIVNTIRAIKKQAF